MAQKGSPSSSLQELRRRKQELEDKKKQRATEAALSTTDEHFTGSSAAPLKPSPILVAAEKSADETTPLYDEMPPFVKPKINFEPPESAVPAVPLASPRPNWAAHILEMMHQPLNIFGGQTDPLFVDGAVAAPAPPSGGRKLADSDKISTGSSISARPVFSSSGSEDASAESSSSDPSSREPSVVVVTNVGWADAIKMLEHSPAPEPYLVSPGEYRDAATVEQQLRAILKTTGTALCKRGWRCWDSSAPCGGRIDLPTVMANTGTVVHRRQKTPEELTQCYKHRLDALDPSDEGVQLEYIAAILFLRDCEENRYVGRRSDDLLIRIDVFLDCALERHPLRKPEVPTKTPKDSPDRLRLLDRIAQRKVRVSNGVLIAAAIYLKLVRMDELCDSDTCKGLVYVPIYIQDEHAGVMTNHHKQSKLVRTARSSSALNISKQSVSTAADAIPAPSRTVESSFSPRKGSVLSRVFGRSLSSNKLSALQNPKKP